MRFLHIADLHLGFALNGVSFHEEQEHALCEIREIIRREHIGAVLIAGDVFDRAVTSADTLALYDRFLTALRCEDHVSTFLIAGNHDGGARLAQLSAILSASDIYICGMLTERPKPILCGDCEVWLVPFFHTDQVRLLYPEEPINSANDAMASIVGDILQRRDPSKKSVLVAHCFVNGAQLSESDVGARLGGASLIGADAFDGLDYVALGHLHGMQHPSARVWYAGSPYPYSFSEGEKYAVIYDSESDEIAPVPLHPLRRLRTLSGTYDEVLAIAESDGSREDYMRIILTDRSVGLETLERFRERYPRLLLVLGASETVGQGTTLTTEELASMEPKDLLTRFCLETAGYQPDADEIELFLQALREAGEEDVQ